MRALFNECGESVEDGTARIPCHSCGSLARRYDDALSERLSAGGPIDTKSYAAGLSKTKGLRFHSRDGDSFCVDLGRYVQLNRLVDRENRRYSELVIDPVTGDVLRTIEESLFAHQGRGSAKGRKPKE